MGLGVAATNANVGICHGGECALALGISIVEAVIESIKNIEIVIAAILFFRVFILFFLFLKNCVLDLAKINNSFYPNELGWTLELYKILC